MTYRLTARQDQRKWRAELAEKYALLSADQPRAAQALARQFAVGVLIIEQGDTHGAKSVHSPLHTDDRGPIAAGARQKPGWVCRVLRLQRNPAARF